MNRETKGNIFVGAAGLCVLTVVQANPHCCAERRGGVHTEEVGGLPRQP